MPNSLKVGWWATELKQPLNAYCPIIGKFIATIEEEEGGMSVVSDKKLEKFPRLYCISRRAHNEEIRRKGWATGGLCSWLLQARHRNSTVSALMSTCWYLKQTIHPYTQWQCSEKNDSDIESDSITGISTAVVNELLLESVATIIVSFAFEVRVDQNVASALVVICSDDDDGGSAVVFERTQCLTWPLSADIAHWL